MGSVITQKGEQNVFRRLKILPRDNFARRACSMSVQQTVRIAVRQLKVR